MTDAELLEAYSSRQDDVAFSELMRRHGAMVYRACHRLLKDAHEAEDASQAVFVVLARKAGKLRKGDLSAWLYRTAHFVAAETVRKRMHRTGREEVYAVNAAIQLGEFAQDEIADPAVLGLVDTALLSLPERYRQAVILRYLQNHSEKEAAQRADCPLGTLSRRASQGIAMLRKRLCKLGVATSVTALAGLLTSEASAAVPETLLPSILATVKSVAATGAATTTVTTTAAMLAKGAMKAMFIAKVKMVAAVAAAVVVTGTAVPVGIAVAQVAKKEAATSAASQPSNAAALDVQVPSSTGEVRRVDTPELRVPFLKTPPTIDGVMSPGEWEDAAALSAFFDGGRVGAFTNLAVRQIQPQVYAGYDSNNLYFCFTTPIYPEGPLKAQCIYPDTLSHPKYGMISDDHMEIEIRPDEDLISGSRRGLFCLDVNPICTVADWYYSPSGGQDFRWNAGATIRSLADGKRWVVEYAIPLKSLRYGDYDAKDAKGNPLVALPPSDGTTYRVWFACRIGDRFSAFDGHAGDTTKTKLILDSQSPAFQLNDLGPIMDGKVDVQMTVKNHSTSAETVRVGFHVESTNGLVYSSYQAAEVTNGLVELRPGELRKLRFQQDSLKLTPDNNVLWFDVRNLGSPEKTVFRTRLTTFQRTDGFDSMLLKWVLLSYDTRDYVKSLERCDQLISEYPGSPHAEKARLLRPKILEQLNKSGSAAGQVEK